jgi:hypothetical protein
MHEVILKTACVKVNRRFDLKRPRELVEDVLELQE